MTEPAAQTETVKTIYVGNLAPNVTVTDLKQLFGLETTPYLRSSCKCELRVKENGKTSNAGFAFITVPEHVSSELLHLNGIEFYGRQLVIEEKQTRGDGEKKKKTTGKTPGKGGRRQPGGRWRKKGQNKFDLPQLTEDQKYEIIDGGANLTNPKFHANKELVLRRAASAGVNTIVVTGLKLNGCQNAQVMAETTKGVYAAVGVHPHFAKDDWNEAARLKIAELAVKDEVVAIGEVGLDYHRKYSDIDVMKSAFESQVKIAVDCNKPLLVHDREASKDVIEILSKFTLKKPVVIFCMTGSEEQIKEYVARGYFIGITGFLCKEKAGQHIRDAIANKSLPLKNIIVHSDAPHMIPNGPIAEQDPVTKSLLEHCFMGNEPCTLNITVRKIAECLSKDKDVKEVAAQLLATAKSVFKI